MIAVKEDQGTKDFVLWQNSVGFFGCLQNVLDSIFEVWWQLRKFWWMDKNYSWLCPKKNCREPNALSMWNPGCSQQMISVKNLKFSSFDWLQKLATGATVHGRAQLLDTKNGFLLTDFFAKQTKFCIVLTRPKPVPVGSYVPQFRSWRHAWHVITWLLISLSWSIGISSRWIRGLTHSARCRFFRQVLAVNDLHKEQGKIESLWR